MENQPSYVPEHYYDTGLPEVAMSTEHYYDTGLPEVVMSLNIVMILHFLR